MVVVVAVKVKGRAKSSRLIEKWAPRDFTKNEDVCGRGCL